MAAAPAVGSGGGGGGGLVEKLRELNDARSEGLIDDAEFQSLKSAALGRLIGSAAVAPSSASAPEAKHMGERQTGRYPELAGEWRPTRQGQWTRPHQARHDATVERWDADGRCEYQTSNEDRGVIVVSSKERDE